MIALVPDDVDKRIETADGDVLGTVTMTGTETTYVDVNANARSTFRMCLERGGGGELAAG
ncbi:hypothetical protein [Natrinema altunense]|uniref:Uncharacterized protein n=1 Tax=Natrinema altunense TaxID=222984 RepID=A0A482XXD6_9EURY|nr:hypothetical protein [Natrinema altunense]RZH68548.1 hypothetical protein ELS17_03520 [Natrinema altunense]